jgi:hypothetical protein
MPVFFESRCMDVARTAGKRAVLFAAIFFAPPQTSTKKDFRCHHSRTFEYKQKLKCYSNDSFLIYQLHGSCHQDQMIKLKSKKCIAVRENDTARAQDWNNSV